ncbi:MAG: hypothetical protein ACPG4X_19880 [Pikeienuella sp.]
MSINAASGTTVAVSAAKPATYNQAGYEALSFTTTIQVTNIGTLGVQWDEVQLDTLDLGRFYSKGTKNVGDLSMAFGLDYTDAGQAILESAAEATGTSGECSVKITLPDTTVLYAYGPVLSFLPQIGGPNDAITVDVLTKPNSDSFVKV